MKRFCLMLLCLISFVTLTTEIISINANINMEITTMSNLEEILYSATEINSIIDSKTTRLENNEVIGVLKRMLEGHHEVPALSVSLDSETRTALKTGTWLEFNYDKTISYNDMPFDKLTIEVSLDAYGFNIIRHYNNKYEGRCFYINLASNMKVLYDYLHR